MPVWMLVRRSRLFAWPPMRQKNWSHRACTRLRPMCVKWLLGRKTRVALLKTCQSYPEIDPTFENVPSDLRRASRRFFSSSSFEARMDLTAGMKADCSISIHSCDRIYEAYFSAVSSSLLQRGRFQFSKTSGTDTLTTRLLLW